MEKTDFELLMDKLATKGFAHEKQRKLGYAIVALITLYRAYGENPEIARETNDSTANQIVRSSLVKQTMRDYEDTYPIQYIQGYMRRLF